MVDPITTEDVYGWLRASTREPYEEDGGERKGELPVVTIGQVDIEDREALCDDTVMLTIEGTYLTAHVFVSAGKLVECLELVRARYV